MMVKYSSYKVGYFGDKAGVALTLTEPFLSASSKPKDKMNRDSYSVLRTCDFFTEATLAKAIQEVSARQDSATLDVLVDAQLSLKRFVEKNGITNWREAADWGDAQPIVA